MRLFFVPNFIKILKGLGGVAKTMYFLKKKQSPGAVTPLEIFAQGSP
jgi:hypothetical protein